jgi:glycosyltransferase involved in cell wall biosynthesis
LTDVKLSICIPTYNRAPYLRSALECLAAAGLDFGHEIVISDNASTDDTAAVVGEFIDRGLPIRYLPCPVNAGPVANFLNAMHHAVGDYIVYQGDDDFLVGEGLRSAVAYLDANPDVVAVQSPWYLYDEVADADLSTLYRLDAERKFAAQDFVGAFQFLFEGHIFPEIGIYRAAVMKTMWVPRTVCFWAFAYLAHFLDVGAVAFLPQPFYRSTTVSKIAPHRHQEGHQDVMTSWDMYRGGLEYFLHFAQQRGKLTVNDQTRVIYDRMCTVFVVIRMAVAVRLWAQRGDYIRAYELYTRMAIAGYGDYPGVGELREHFPVMVGLQTMAQTVNAIPTIRFMMLSEMTDPAYVGTLLRDVGLAERIEIVSDLATHDAALVAQTAVLVTNSAREAAILAMGYDPNFIFREGDLTRTVLV